MIVVDASLAAKWFLWVEDTHYALRFLFHYGRSLRGPDLLFTEVAGAIVSHAHKSKASLGDITADALEALRKWTIAWDGHAVRPHRVTQRRLYQAGKIALTLGHPVADCIYLVLAAELGCELATCDAKFQAKAREKYPQVKMLRDFDLPPNPAIRED